ncbi:hypothetical protein [Virgibacillus necropolis]|uniref:hypothetical protein n=1 Tax=Virgibacillus necropolis TaxID=163877 RepID=UPI0013747A41|nr:hypothetical protein [Virgibacillus necropolis]
MEAKLNAILESLEGLKQGQDRFEVKLDYIDEKLDEHKALFEKIGNQRHTYRH